MKPWVPLTICIAIAASGLALCGCSESEEDGVRKKGDPEKGAGSFTDESSDDQAGGKPSKSSRREESRGQAFIRDKLKSIVIPKIDFEDTTVEEAIDFMRLRTLELDPDPDPMRKGVSVIIGKESKRESEDFGQDSFAREGDALRIKNLRMENVSAWDLLHLIAREAGMQVEITDVGILMSPR